MPSGWGQCDKTIRVTGKRNRASRARASGDIKGVGVLETRSDFGCTQFQAASCYVPEPSPDDVPGQLFIKEAL